MSSEIKYEKETIEIVNKNRKKSKKKKKRGIKIWK